jgi:hypothetical protein
MAFKELSKYLLSDICKIIINYTNTDISYYNVNKLVKYNNILELRTNFITYTILTNNISYYYDYYGIVQILNNNMVKQILNKYILSFGICEMNTNDNKIIFVVKESLYLTIYNEQMKQLHKIIIENISSILTYGEFIYYISYEYNITNNKRKSYGLLTKLHCKPNGDIVLCKTKLVAGCARPLVVNIDGIFIRVGNKCVQYDINTLCKITKVNIGRSIRYGTIKNNNLLLLTNDKQITIDLYNKFTITNISSYEYNSLFNKEPTIVK